MKKEILKIEYVSKSNSINKVLQNICINIFQGEVVKLVGKRSDGAAELISILGGNSLPDYGDLYIDGRKVALASPKIAQKYGVGILSQQIGLMPNYTVMECLLLGNRRWGRKLFTTDKLRFDKCSEIISWLGINAGPETLLGDIEADQKPLISLGNVLLKDPKIIVLDFLNLLNATQAEHYIRVFNVLSKRNIAVLIFSDDVDMFTDMAERIYILNEGCIVGNIKTDMYDRHRILEAIETKALISSN